MEKSDIFNIEIIVNFYKYLYTQLHFAGFRTITPERREELDKIVKRWEYYFESRTTGYKSKLNMVAERLRSSYGWYGLKNGDDVAYFFIKMMDPTLQHLIAFESSSLTDEMKETCYKTFRVYDKNMINLQKIFNDHFKIYSPEELWGQDDTKRAL